MRKHNTIRALGLGVLLITLVAGVLHLFMLRFQTGDIYPAYSSLRSDPLGARALHDSLKEFEALAAGRNYHPPHALKFQAQSTFFYLGIPASETDEIPAELSDAFDRLLQSGGRLVLSFLPSHDKPLKKVHPDRSKREVDPQKKAGRQTETETHKPEPTVENKRRTSEKKESSSREAEASESRSGPEKSAFVSLKNHWGVAFKLNTNLPIKDKKRLNLVATSNRSTLPATISWHTNLYFDLLDKNWQSLYACEGQPVIVERSFGPGTIVLAADSFFLSNEALWSERHPRLLAWLIGPNANIIFDENHFGITEQPSVAGLIRRYRFQWFIAALAALASLFIWKNASYFVPPRSDDLETGVDVVAAKDDTQGLTALLRRNISVRRILQVCGQEWEKTFKKDKRIQPVTIEQVNRVVRSVSDSSKRGTNPVEGYQRISRLLSEEKRHG